MKSSAGPQKYNVNLIKFLNLITKKKKKVWQDTHKKEKYLRFQMKNQPNKYLVPGKIISVVKKKLNWGLEMFWTRPWTKCGIRKTTGRRARTRIQRRSVIRRGRVTCKCRRRWNVGRSPCASACRSAAGRLQTCEASVPASSCWWPHGPGRPDSPAGKWAEVRKDIENPGLSVFFHL